MGARSAGGRPRDEMEEGLERRNGDRTGDWAVDGMREGVAHSGNREEILRVMNDVLGDPRLVYLGERSMGNVATRSASR